MNDARRAEISRILRKLEDLIDDLRQVESDETEAAENLGNLQDSRNAAWTYHYPDLLAEACSSLDRAAAAVRDIL